MSVLDHAEMQEKIAQQMQIKLFERFTTESASVKLGFSVSTLNRIRARGDIAFIKLSDRHIAYFGYQLVDFIIGNIRIREESCPNPTKRDSKWETTGYRSKREAIFGAEAISIRQPDKQNALASARRILNAPKSS